MIKRAVILSIFLFGVSTPSFAEIQIGFGGLFAYESIQGANTTVKSTLGLRGDVSLGWDFGPMLLNQIYVKGNYDSISFQNPSGVTVTPQKVTLFGAKFGVQFAKAKGKIAYDLGVSMKNRAVITSESGSAVQLTSTLITNINGTLVFYPSGNARDGVGFGGGLDYYLSRSSAIGYHFEVRVRTRDGDSPIMIEFPIRYEISSNLANSGNSKQTELEVGFRFIFDF